MRLMERRDAVSVHFLAHHVCKNDMLAGKGVMGAFSASDWSIGVKMKFIQKGTLTLTYSNRNLSLTKPKLTIN